MKLTDLNHKNTSSKALKENFNMKFDASSLDKRTATYMLNKVSRALNETRNSHLIHKAHNNSAYMKLVFMEQALRNHLKSMPNTRIVVENTEVEKSQVILAAQDLVDSVQKWYEEVNDMLVKELPALVDSIESEIGVNEAKKYNDKVTQSLDSLNAALKDTHGALKQSIGVLTGQASEPFDTDMSMDDENDIDDLDIDIDNEPDGDTDLDIDLDSEPDMSMDTSDDEENDILHKVGRNRR